MSDLGVKYRLDKAVGFLSAVMTSHVEAKSADVTVRWAGRIQRASDGTLHVEHYVRNPQRQNNRRLENKPTILNLCPLPIRSIIPPVTNCAMILIQLKWRPCKHATGGADRPVLQEPESGRRGA